MPYCIDCVGSRLYGWISCLSGDGVVIGGAMNWLIFLFVFEVGFLPHGDFIMYEELELVPVQYSLYTDLQAEVVISNLLFIGGGVRTGMWYHDGYTFFPHRTSYNFQMGIRRGMVEVGIRHYCFHPVTPFFALLDYGALWEGAYEEIYLRISNQ